MNVGIWGERTSWAVLEAGLLDESRSTIPGLIGGV